MEGGFFGFGLLTVLGAAGFVGARESAFGYEAERHGFYLVSAPLVLEVCSCSCGLLAFEIAFFAAVGFA